MANYYLYNNFKLPALPDWDKTTYPYACIYEAFGTHLILSKEPATVGYRETSLGTLFFGEHLHYKCDTDGWYYHESANELSIIGGILWELWSNHDIYNENDGTLHNAASDPVPVGGEPTLTARDLYRKINGQHTKLTLYKKVSGELLPLDEYTQGGNL